jgi:hypothetical protein
MTRTTTQWILALAEHHVRVPFPEGWQDKTEGEQLQWLLSLKVPDISPLYAPLVRELQAHRSVEDNLKRRAWHLEGLM